MVFRVITYQTQNDDIRYLLKRAKINNQNYSKWDGQILAYTIVYNKTNPVQISIAQHRSFYPKGVVGLFRKLYSEIKIPNRNKNLYAETMLKQQWTISKEKGFHTGFFSTEKKISRFFYHQIPRWESITGEKWYFGGMRRFILCPGKKNCFHYLAWCGPNHLAPFKPVRE